ncbi:MAG: hypothetical protein ACREP9_02085 [Candidatus Dormibacteraceae bacterium]
MSPSGNLRTQSCSIAQSRTRLEHSHKFLDVAQLTAAGIGDAEYAKDEAHYGLVDIAGQDLQTALRQAKILVKFAEEILSR